MLNYLWGGMILTAVIVAAFTSNLPAVTTAVIDSSKEAIELCITMLGILAAWSGLIEIAQRSGLISALTHKLRPFLIYLFPDIPPEHKAMTHISTNIIANLLGLGWAATPAGINAMYELQKLNKDKTTASHSMCMFMIFNMSSLQLISVNLLAYRSKYNSANPSEIIGAGLFATLISSIAGVLFAKIYERFDRK